MRQAVVYTFPGNKGHAPGQPICVHGGAGQKQGKEREVPCKAELALPDLERCLHEQKDGLLITNGEGIGLWVNGAMRKVVGLTPDYFIDKPIKHLFEKGIFRYQAVTERARCGKNELTDIQAVSNGNTVLVTSVPVMNKKGQIEYMITTVRNMAQLRKAPRTGSGEPLNRADLDSVLRRLGIVYRSRAMGRLIDLVARVAATDATVLITGETGVGKEVIARLIHELSPRRNRPFLKINCAALPKELVESELFGYEPGAFTGARAGGKVGLFEAADGGTLLLDEVGEMPLDMQAKLLRVLQEQEVLRLGGTRTRSVNVRVLAATNVELWRLVNEGRFRPDLYHRLNVIPLEVPPLRARPEDIPLLLGHYLRLYCGQYRVKRLIGPEALKRLLSYSWPGNVRELANLVHRLVLVADRTEITPQLLPDYVGGEMSLGALLAISPLGLPDPQVGPLRHRSLQEIVADVEREVIELTLTEAPSIREAARRLGISHSTLLSKVKKYNLKIPL